MARVVPIVPIVALAALLALPGVARAGIWSFSVPASYCQAVNPGTPNAPTLTQVTFGFLGSLSMPKDVWAFASTANGQDLWCDVMFPTVVNTNMVTATLTLSTSDTTAGANVGWGLRWNVTLPGSVWSDNDGSQGVEATTTVGVPNAADGDVDVGVSLTAVTQAGDACVVGALPNTCAGHHGVLRIRRLPSSAITSDSAQPARLERITLSGVTP